MGIIVGLSEITFLALRVLIFFSDIMFVQVLLVIVFSATINTGYGEFITVTSILYRTK